ncbi:glycosyltransferase family 4 protein [Roseibium sp.]|uniref:glycosyltransferase family 4 protein n=1 Tax=Roseibium sp. TaxID=1936156 RepID=UPI00261A014F|nr:glycosyltransferase family 4 protein [Roseibium sp.]
MTTGLEDVSVVHVVRQYLPNVGGLENVVRNLVIRQKERVRDVKVVTLDRLFADPDRILSRYELIDGVEVHRIPYRGSSRYPVAPAVFKEVSGADLVHVHAVDFFFDALAIANFRKRRKMVATTHGGFFHTDKFATLKAGWFNTLTRLSSHQYEAIACCSSSDFQQFQKIAPKRVSLIENGVDIDKFRDASSQKPEKQLLALGRFSSNKRLDRVIDLLKQLNSQDREWKLDIVGMESDLTKADLLAKAEAAGVACNLQVHVGLEDVEIRSVMRKCSFFVSASDYEGFGLVLIEAMSAGLIPVVHPNDAFKGLAGQHDLITLADYSRPELAASAITERFCNLKQIPKLRQDIIGAVESHSWDHVIEQYDQLYRTALGIRGIMEA